MCMTYVDCGMESLFIDSLIIAIKQCRLSMMEKYKLNLYFVQFRLICLISLDNWRRLYRHSSALHYLYIVVIEYCIVRASR